MAGSVTSATSSLASELLLNKIMNGQAQTSTGQTITAAGRAVSSRLNGDAYEAYAAKTNMEYGTSLVETAQGEFSNLRNQLEAMKANLMAVAGNGAATKTEFKNAGGNALSQWTAMSAAAATVSFNGKKLLTGASLALNGGAGLTIKVLNEKAMTGAFKSVKAKIGSANITNAAKANDAITMINKAIEEITGKEGKYSDVVKNLQNRSLLLESQNANLNTAAAQQSVMGMGGANNLLGTMLGNTNA